MLLFQIINLGNASNVSYIYLFSKERPNTHSINHPVIPN